MRKFVNQYGYIVVIVAVGIGLAWTGFNLYSRRGAARPSQAFYVDEETGEESLGKSSDVPPLMGRNGKPTLCKALKYTCDAGATKRIYLLIKYPPEVQAEISALPKNDAVSDLRRSELMLNRYLVRSPVQGSPWYPAKSQQGMELESVPSCPDGTPGQVVYP